MKILVINAGSSSLKYQLMDPTSGEVFAKGLCERIYIDGKLTHKVPATGLKVERDIPMPTHSEAIEAVLSILVDPEYGVLKSTDEIDAIGHRVLHGGDKFVESCIIDEACKQAIRDCIPLGPLHNPANLMGIEACEKVMPGKPQVAVPLPHNTRLTALQNFPLSIFDFPRSPILFFSVFLYKYFRIESAKIRKKINKVRKYP